MSMDITSPQLHVHLYLWPRVPYGLFLENLHPQGRYCCQQLRLARMQELRLDDNKADTWRQDCGEVLYGFGPNQTFRALTWPLYCPDDDLMMIWAATIGDVMGLILIIWWWWWWWFLSILFEASDCSETEPEDRSDRFRFHCCWVFAGRRTVVEAHRFSCWMFLLLCPHATSCNAGFSPCNFM